MISLGIWFTIMGVYLVVDGADHSNGVVGTGFVIIGSLLMMFGLRCLAMAVVDATVDKIAQTISVADLIHCPYCEDRALTQVALDAHITAKHAGIIGDTL